MSDMDENFDMDDSQSTEDAIRYASEANASMLNKLDKMDEYDLRQLASDIESVLAERFAAADVKETDGGMEMMYMYLPQTMMNAVFPYIEGILLTEDDVEVVANSDLPLMCRVEGYLSVH